jgi:uncharacterized surface protein with fasciclin (FAS1) repeats
MKTAFRLFILVFGLGALAACSSAADDRTAFTKAVASSRIYGFMEILRNSGLPEETVNGPAVTLIIPVDTTFYTLPPEKYQALLSPANKELAAKYIKAHVVTESLKVADLAAGSFKTMGGVELKAVAKTGTEPGRINGAKVILADQAGGKGIFHLVDGFLWIP